MRFDWRYYLVKYPSMRGGDSGIYYGVSGQLGYSMCMLRKTQRNSYYRDPILLELWNLSGVGERVHDPWFTGYETSARWLRLARSAVGIRSVDGGFVLQAQDNEELDTACIDICRRHGSVEIKADAILLRIPQHEWEGRMIDSVDRIVVGAALLKELVEAGR